MARPDLPDPAASRQLAQWLAGARGRLLRRAQIGLRERILEVGCGHGFVTEELTRRCPGLVTALDRDTASARAAGVAARLVQADARELPLASESCDLVLFQNVLLWVDRAESAIPEAARVLRPGGYLLAIEPDFGGMIEHPPEIGLREVWLEGLGAAGADPLIGRKLPGMCESAGLEVWVELLHVPQPSDPAALTLLDDLPLPASDRARVEDVRQRLTATPGRWQALIHVPYFLIAATKRPQWHGLLQPPQPRRLPGRLDLKLRHARGERLPREKVCYIRSSGKVNGARAGGVGEEREEALIGVDRVIGVDVEVRTGLAGQPA
jgi:SAM-dependent methyltransferase